MQPTMPQCYLQRCVGVADQACEACHRSSCAEHLRPTLLYDGTTPFSDDWSINRTALLCASCAEWAGDDPRGVGDLLPIPF